MAQLSDKPVRLPRLELKIFEFQNSKKSEKIKKKERERESMEHIPLPSKGEKGGSLVSSVRARACGVGCGVGVSGGVSGRAENNQG